MLLVVVRTTYYVVRDCMPSKETVEKRFIREL